MKTEKELFKIIENVSSKEILKLRQFYSESNNIDEYLYKMFRKIFKKYFFLYFRFEILLRSINDVINNSKDYPYIKNKDIRRINSIFSRLKKICLYLNLALNEYNKMVHNIKR